MKTKMFFAAALLLLAAGNAFAGFSVRWDTVYQCKHSGPIYGMAFIPNTDRFYASYNIDNHKQVLWIDTLQTLCEFTDITGDTLKSIAQYTYDYTLTDLIAINDTNYLLGYDGRYMFRKINKTTGASEEIYYSKCLFFKTQNLSEDNCIFFGTSTGYINKLSLDSLKIVNTISSIPEPNLPHPLWYKPKISNFQVSPSGKYIFINSNTNYSSSGNELRHSANYILDMNDFSIYRKIYYKDWGQDFKNDTLNYRTAIFSDDDSKIAMQKNYNDSIIDIYDVNSLELLRRVKTIGRNNSYQFDSTGNYLVLVDGINSLSNNVYYVNINTGEIDYFSYGNYPLFAKRQYFTNIFRRRYYGSSEWSFDKFRFYTSTSDIEEIRENSLTASYSNDSLILNSSESKTITNMKLVDIRGNEVYSSNSVQQTPLSINLQLLTGAYYLIVSVDGTNEFYKIIAN